MNPATGAMPNKRRTNHELDAIALLHRRSIGCPRFGDHLSSLACVVETFSVLDIESLEDILLKYLQKVLDSRGFLLRRKNKWTDVPLSILPAIVDHYSAGLGRSCVAVQIGANDGQANDHLRWCLKYCDVQALLVEPMPVPFERLCEYWGGHPKIELEQCAVSDEDGELTLYAFAVKGQARLTSSRVASFSREHVEAHRQSHASPDAEIIELEVPAKRFSTLLKDHSLSSVDLLVVDTEGMDCKILNQALKSVMPGIIYFEHAHVSSKELRTTLLELTRRDYLVFSLFADTVCLQKSHFTAR